MGLLDGTTHREYYEGGDFGYYQFISLEDIINQFMVTHVGKQKIINTVSKIDVAFHAQRALAELSFDVFKSVKSYQIDVSNLLTIPLPHDYINYTKLTWVDSSGIKHPLYPTNRTSNPFQIRQDEDSDGSYAFEEDYNLVVNGDFSAPTLANNKPALPWNRNGVAHINHYTTNYTNINASNDNLMFAHRTRSGTSSFGITPFMSHAMSAWQKLDVRNLEYVNISATATAVDQTNGTGTLRLGLFGDPITSPSQYASVHEIVNNTKIVPVPNGSNTPLTKLIDKNIFDLLTSNGSPSYLEWQSSNGIDVVKELDKIDVRQYQYVYVLVLSFQNFTDLSESLAFTNRIDDIKVSSSYASEYLTNKIGNETQSSTWKNYKSGTPSENQDDYQDDTYWPMDGSRFGLDPQHAQANGSFFIDSILGNIHFSSNISGKTIILDYISDSLGTDEEMKVHKFAEEAMYKWITHAVLSTSSYGQALVPRLTKDKFAAVRKAKLRLSNIKLEELTQVLRGKSKQIKH